MSPHFQLEIDEDTLSTEVTIPQTARVDAAVSRTALAGALTCTVDPLRSSPGFLPSCEIMPSQAGVGLSQNSTLTVRVRRSLFGVFVNLHHCDDAQAYWLERPSCRSSKNATVCECACVLGEVRHQHEQGNDLDEFGGYAQYNGCLVQRQRSTEYRID